MEQNNNQNGTAGQAKKRRCVLTGLHKRMRDGEDVAKELDTLMLAYGRELLGLHGNRLNETRQRRARRIKVANSWYFANQLRKQTSTEL